MKLVFALTLTLASYAIGAQEIRLEDYSWTLTDVESLGVTKEDLFKKMDRDTIVTKSICANRALMWLYEFKKDHNIDGSKIFLFYTGSRTQFSVRRWWYHVAPIINERGTEFVMDAGFPSIKGPLLVRDWVKKCVGNNNCYEIKAGDHDLAELMYKGAQFPKETFRGRFDCYYAKVPAGFWFPRMVADSILGENVPSEINEQQVYSACLEASTGPIGGVLRQGKKKCREFMARSSM